MPNHQLAIVVGIIEYKDRFLMTRRVAPQHPEWDQKWEFPGGKIDPGETPEQAVVREIKEETGLSIYGLELLGIHTHFWDCKNFIQQTFLICYRCKTDSNKICLNPNESDDFLWLTTDEFYLIQSKLDSGNEIFHNLYLTKTLQLTT